MFKIAYVSSVDVRMIVIIIETDYHFIPDIIWHFSQFNDYTNLSHLKHMPEIIQFDAFEYEVEMKKMISLIQYGRTVLRYQKR